VLCGVFVSVLYQVEFPGHRVLRVLETNSALRRNVATLPATSTEFIQVGPWWSIEPREQFLSIIFHDIRPEEPVLANRSCLPFETTAVRILHAGGDRRGDPDGRVGDEAARIRSDQKVPLTTPASVFRLNWKWISLILSIRIGSGRPLFLTATYWASRYPVLVYVYGEPHAQTVLDAWGTAHADYHRAIAEMVFARKQTCSLFCGCHLPYVKMSTRPDRLGTKTNENLKLKRRGAFSLLSSLRVISSFQLTTAAPPAPKALRGAAPSPAASDRFPPRSRCEMSFSSC
jgi:hypothetical protein